MSRGHALWLSILLFRLQLLLPSRNAKLLISDASEKFIEFCVTLPPLLRFEAHEKRNEDNG